MASIVKLLVRLPRPHRDSTADLRRHQLWLLKRDIETRFRPAILEFAEGDPQTICIIVEGDVARAARDYLLSQGKVVEETVIFGDGGVDSGPEEENVHAQTAAQAEGQNAEAKEAEEEVLTD